VAISAAIDGKVRHIVAVVD